MILLYNKLRVFVPNKFFRLPLRFWLDSEAPLVLVIKLFFAADSEAALIVNEKILAGE